MLHSALLRTHLHHADPTPAPTSAASIPSESLRVLVVDDHPTNRLVMQTILAIAKITAVMAEDGLQALEAWRREPWDIVFMDIQMPHMDGVTATREIRRLEAEDGRDRTLIIALTANVMPEQVQSYAEAGVDACVAKPIDVPNLLSVIREQAARRLDDGPLRDASGRSAAPVFPGERLSSQVSGGGSQRAACP